MQTMPVRKNFGNQRLLEVQIGDRHRQCLWVTCSLGLVGRRITPTILLKPFEPFEIYQPPIKIVALSSFKGLRDHREFACNTAAPNYFDFQDSFGFVWRTHRKEN